MENWFEAARTGDRDGQGELVRLVRHFAQIICRSGGPSGAYDLDWEDVAQESLRKLYSVALGQYRGQGSERSYLYSIVKSTVIQMSRSATRRRRREESVAAEDKVPAHNPFDRLVVGKVLALVSSDCQDLLERVFLYDEPYAVLAQDLDLAESSVRAKLSRCIRRARIAAIEAGIE